MTPSAAAPARSLLEELEARQDQVLQQLEDLNDRIERLLREHTAGRSESESRAMRDAEALPNA